MLSDFPLFGHLFYAINQEFQFVGFKKAVQPQTTILIAMRLGVGHQSDLIRLVHVGAFKKVFAFFNPIYDDDVETTNAALSFVNVLVFAGK